MQALDPGKYLREHIHTNTYNLKKKKQMRFDVFMAVRIKIMVF